MKPTVLLLAFFRLNDARQTPLSVHQGDQTAHEAQNYLGEVHDLYKSHDYHAPGATDFFPDKFLGLLREAARKQLKSEVTT